MKRSLLIVVLVLTLARLALSQQAVISSDSESDRILTLENAWNQVEQQKDASALDMLLAPELIYVDYDGVLLNKTQYLARVHSSVLHPARIVNESTSIHIYSGVAVVHGVCRQNGVRNGKSYSARTHFTDVWIHRGNQWVYVASQSTLFPR